MGLNPSTLFYRHRVEKHLWFDVFFKQFLGDFSTGGSWRYHYFISRLNLVWVSNSNVCCPCTKQPSNHQNHFVDTKPLLSLFVRVHGDRRAKMYIVDYFFFWVLKTEKKWPLGPFSKWINTPTKIYGHYGFISGLRNGLEQHKPRFPIVLCQELDLNSLQIIKKRKALLPEEV